MKPALHIWLTILSILPALSNAQAQLAEEGHISSKPRIDTALFGKWPSVESGAINRNGNWVLYTIKNQPLNSHTLVIKSILNNWSTECPGGADAVFTSDGRYVVYAKPGDSLVVFSLDTRVEKIIPGVSSYKVARNGKINCLVYQLKGPEKELVVTNLASAKQTHFSGVRNFQFNSEGTLLLLYEENSGGTGASVSLTMVSLSGHGTTTFWTSAAGNAGSSARKFTFDKQSNYLAFIAGNEKNSGEANSLVLYKVGDKNAHVVLRTDSLQGGAQWQIASIIGFSADSKRVFITFKKNEKPTEKNEDALVDIWRYSDPKLHSYEVSGSSRENYSTAVYDLLKKKLTWLQFDNEVIDLSNLYSEGYGNDEYALVVHKEGDCDDLESNWNPVCRTAVYLESTLSGQRTLVRQTKDGLGMSTLSPDGRYVLFFDLDKRNYFSFDRRTGKTSCITRGIEAIWTIDSDQPLMSRYPVGIAGWLPKDGLVLLYDRTDIWMVDLSGIKKPVSLTAGFGKDHHIAFRVLKSREEGTILQKGGTVLLSAFNLDNKENGFYKTVIGEGGYPELLSMGPYIYSISLDLSAYLYEYPPLKAGDSQHYLVRRMSAKESPNYFLTSDFKNFIPVSGIYPEKNYNWLTAELHSWETPDGMAFQGVLYKPDNFDPQKKYPVIFHYYERMSQCLNNYFPPEATETFINIPYFVSNGFLVFTPDIHFDVGRTGESAVQSLTGAASYLATKPWVDSARFGLQGHSYGGFITNYLITHSKRFAAAVSSSGVSDLISGYGGLLFDGRSQKFYYELEQGRMGVSLWQDPELYVRNSPVMSIPSVTTPVLLMSDPNDRGVPLSQAIEFFTGLRREGKKAWLLVYKDGAHGVQGKSAIDYSLRIMQFFNHYLKQTPPPKWMITDISGNGSEFELDSTTTSP